MQPVVASWFGTAPVTKVTDWEQRIARQSLIYAATLQMAEAIVRATPSGSGKALARSNAFDRLREAAFWALQG